MLLSSKYYNAALYHLTDTAKVKVKKYYVFTDDIEHAKTIKFSDDESMIVYISDLEFKSIEEFFLLA